MRTRGKGVTLVDVAALASSFGLEEPKLHAVLDAPTTELVRELLTSLTAKAEEFDAARAEKLRATVELENTVRTNESKTKALRSSITKSQREVEDLRNNVSALENSRAELQSELDRVKSNSSNSSVEVETLHNRIAELEASNREALSVVESKASAQDKLTEELGSQHQRIVALRREIAGLEEKSQSLESAGTAARFREQNLDQEVSLLKKNITWHEQELKTRGEEFSKFRKEKNGRIAELQRQAEDATSTIEASQRSDAALRKHIDDITQKAEGAFGKIHNLQEAAIAADSAFKEELDSARRLADLQKQSADTARSRLQEVTASLDQLKDAAADEIGQLQAEVETERSEKAVLETRLAEIEAEIERLQAHRPHTPIPGTPVRSTNGLAPNTPLRAGSPSAYTPVTARTKLNNNFTQLFTENNTLKADLEDERRRNVKLTAELEEIIQDLENRGPEQEDFRQDKERMEAEVMEMSQLLESALTEKDTALVEARKWEGKVAGITKETQVLRQQLRDLSAQIKVMLVEMQARDQGLDGLDPAGQAQLQMLAAGEIDQDALGDQTSAGSLITQRLLLFRNVDELQEQNVQLLKLNRGLADQMEGDEARLRDAEKADRVKENDDLRQRLRQHEDELRSSTTQLHSITRERDMFRRMLNGRASSVNGDDESVLGDSIIHNGLPATPRPGRGDERTLDIAATPSRLPDLVKELQAHVDAIRQESSTNQGILRQQVDQLAKDKSEIQTELARSAGQVMLAQERFEMLQGNYRMVQGENGELQKRNQTLNENAAKQDLRTQQVVEELVDVKALAESMRTEAANLKAERELWKKIEARITEDNHLLTEERNRLSKMVADLQNLQNEREQADADTRRRLHTRIESLESELQTVRNKLEATAEENKKAHLRREYEQDQSKTRIDDLIKSLANVREELIAAKTTRDQLQTRVDEMKIDLRNAEERAQALQPRPSAGAPSNGTSDIPSVDNNLSHEQELALEVADLKRDVELAKSEVDNARNQVEQFKAIAMSSEEELQSLNDTYDQYREDNDRQLAEKEGAIQQLEQRIADLNNELTTSNAELSNLRTQHEQSGMQLEQQKTALEGEVARLREEYEKQTEKAWLHQQDLKAQAEIAQQAQQSYEDELVKHADAAKNLQGVRAEYNTLRTEVASIRAEAEAAKVTLSQGQETWSDLKLQYEKELSDARASRDDLKAQNRLVHEQLEAVSRQIASLQQHRSAAAADEKVDATEQTPGSKLQEVVSYLRREKEIVDVQCELATQEAKRLKQQLEYTQLQLDETRVKLGEERRDRTSQETNAANHNKLVETINELNLYRESSATLRQESRQAQAKLQERIKEVEELTGQILPLQAEIRDIESELEIKTGELRLLQEDRDRWRERTQNIISKYDRVDPAEIESMKSRISELESERDGLQQARQDLQQEVDSLPEKLQQMKDDAEKAEKSWAEVRGKLIEQAKNRSKEQSAKIKELQSQASTLQEEKSNLETALSQTQNALEALQLERDTASVARDPAQQTGQTSTSEQSGNDAEQAEEGEVAEESTDANRERTAALQDAEDRATAQAARADVLENEIASLQSSVEAHTLRIAELEQQVVSDAHADAKPGGKSDAEQVELEQQAQSANAEQPLSAADNTSTEPSSNTAELDGLREQLSAAQEELQTLRVLKKQPADSSDETTQPVPDADAGTQVAAQVAELKRQLEEQHELSKSQMQAEYERRTNGMKATLNQKLKEGREKAREEGREEVRQELVTQHSQELKALEAKHQEELKVLKEEHQRILDRVTREGAEAVQRANTSTATATDAEATGVDADSGNSAVGDAPVNIQQLQLSVEQAKDLLRTNEHLRNIVRANITKRVNDATQSLKDEQEKQLAAKDKSVADQVAAAKAGQDEAVKKAVNMEAIKQRAKLGMAEGQFKSSKAKLDIVETAARDTPQRAVVEVWEIAKNTKAAPTAPATAPSSQPTVPPSSAQAATTSQSTSASATTAAAPTSAAAPDDQSRLAARQAKFGVSANAPQAGADQPDSAQANGVKSEPLSDSAPKPAQPATATRGGIGIPRAGVSGLPARGTFAGRGRGGLPQPSASAAAGTASQIGRGGQSGLPRGGFRGAAGRGGSVGRGGASSAAAATPVAAAGNAGGSLNVGAKQFVPGGAPAQQGAQAGAKRPLEGAEQAQGDEKRARGAGGSAA